MESETLKHTLPPVYDVHSRVLMLGSFPSPKSRATGFDYGHPQNRFLRVLAEVLGEPLPTWCCGTASRSGTSSRSAG